MIKNNEQYDLMVWDLETTGFVAPASKILEIGIWLIKGDKITKKRWVIDNKCEIPEHITAINGFTQAICSEEGKAPLVVLKEFLAYFSRIKRHVTHNGVKFDIPFLVDYAMAIMEYEQERRREILESMLETAFDTAVWYKANKMGWAHREGTYKKFSDSVMHTRVSFKYNLGHCCDEFKIDRTEVEQHRALGDVELTYKLYKAIEPLLN